MSAGLDANGEPPVETRPGEVIEPVERGEFDALAKRVDAVERKLPDLYRQIDELRETILESIHDEMRKLRVEISSLGAAIRRVDSGVAAMDRRLDALRTGKPAGKPAATTRRRPATRR